MLVEIVLAGLTLEITIFLLFFISLSKEGVLILFFDIIYLLSFIFTGFLVYISDFLSDFLGLELGLLISDILLNLFFN